MGKDVLAAVAWSSETNPEHGTLINETNSADGTDNQTNVVTDLDAALRPYNASSAAMTQITPLNPDVGSNSTQVESLDNETSPLYLTTAATTAATTTITTTTTEMPFTESPIDISEINSDGFPNPFPVSYYRTWL